MSSVRILYTADLRSVPLRLGGWVASMGRTHLFVITSGHHSGQVTHKAESMCSTPRRQLSTNRQTSALVESRMGRQAPQQVDSGSRNLNREGAGKGIEEEATERTVGNG